jgi:O-acetyl-ADP-ribose deacetylase (regulator of RNase III)
MALIIAREGDIARQQVDAIVNAANTTLLGGGGVDGAIHRAAGPELLAFCRTLSGCETGAAKISPAFLLPAKWVIHTVGPIWRGGADREDELLAQCYRSCLALAAQHQVLTLAFPQISTGAYGFPVKRACSIAVATLRECLAHYPGIEEVRIVSFGTAAHSAMQAALNAQAGI